MKESLGEGNATELAPGIDQRSAKAKTKTK